MLSQKIKSSLTIFSQAMSNYKNAQTLRAEYLLLAKQAGQLLLEVQEEFKTEGYSKANPLIIKDNSYSSFRKLLKDFRYVYESLIGEIDPDIVDYFSEAHANKCMSLARQWDLAQEIPDLLAVKHTYRLTKTLEIISWFKKKKEQNPDVDPSTFTCDLYWLEQETERKARQEEAQAKPSYRQLEQRLEEAYTTITNLNVEVESLRRQLNQVKPRFAVGIS